MAPLATAAGSNRISVNSTTTAQPDATIGSVSDSDGTSSKPRRFSREDLRELLRVNSAGIIEEIHALALRQNQAEDQRETRLDGKATSLLATAGLSVTVTLAFGNTLATQSNFFSPLHWAARAVPILYVLALALGLLSTVWALRALKIRDDYKKLSDEDVFNSKEFERIERVAQGDENVARREFRRYITVQHWTFFREHSDIHDKKADVVKWGQRFFVGFVWTLLLIGFAITYSALFTLVNR